MKKVSILLISVFFLVGCSQTTQPSQEAVELFFVGDTPRGFKLFSEVRDFPASDELDVQVISDLVSGKLVPLDPDYVNLWGGTNTLNSIISSGVEATIDLGSISLNVGAEGEQRAIDQLVWTYLNLAKTIQSVRFSVNGDTVESFAGHIDTTGEFKRSPAYEVLNPLQISSIQDGAVLISPVTISGQACTFEANVVWRLSNDVRVLDEGFTTSTSACPQRGTWEILLVNLKPGRYKIEALEYSAEDGSLFAYDDKTFLVE
jgi:hypothetical protein